MSVLAKGKAAVHLKTLLDIKWSTIEWDYKCFKWGGGGGGGENPLELAVICDI